MSFSDILRPDIEPWARLTVARRLLWVQNWQTKHASAGKVPSNAARLGPRPSTSPTDLATDRLYPPYPDRYALPSSQVTVTYISQHLQPCHRWILDWQHVLSVEDAKFVNLIERAMKFRQHFRIKLEDATDYLVENKLVKRPEVSRFTTAVAPAQFTIQDQERCIFCVRRFDGKEDETTTNEEMEEHPALTHCGHIFGSKCLQRWVEEGDAGWSCPNCRAPLYTRDVLLPKFAQNYYRTCINYLQALEKADKKIDAYLLEGPKVVHTDNRRFLALKKLLQGSSVAIDAMNNMIDHMKRVGNAALHDRAREPTSDFHLELDLDDTHHLLEFVQRTGFAN